MLGGGGMGQKLDSQVDFPLEGLDLSKHVISTKGALNPSGGSMIYDCYAVSNHYGNMGFGHYTAYARNPRTDKWYEFDDSRVTPVNPSQLQSTVASSAAYNLFYRRRDWFERNKQQGIDFENLALRPDMSYLQSENKKAAER